MIIAVTDADCVLFVEQYRPALECMTIEMPAGLVGDSLDHSAESATEAAGRELVGEGEQTLCDVVHSRDPTNGTSAACPSWPAEH